MTASDDPFTQVLPPELTERSVVRVGVLEAPVSFHIRAGFVRWKEGRLFRIPGDYPRPCPPAVLEQQPSPDPMTLPALEARGYHVLRGKTQNDHRVWLGQNLFMRLSQAIGLGLITPDSLPPKDPK